MFKRKRFFFSASLIAVLLLSFIVLPVEVSAKTRKCPVEPPKTILSLYMMSDLVVTADIADEKMSKSTDPAEDSYYRVERKLDIKKVFKGQKTAAVKFVKPEYRPAEEQNETVVSDEDFYGDIANDRLDKGKRYLFFLAKSPDEDVYLPVDYRSTARELTAGSAVVLEKRLGELAAIFAGKRNQLPQLAEWLVRMIENEETRWDGTMSLSYSFSSLGYEEEREALPITSDSNFSEYTPAIAKQITAAQKDRISAAFLTAVNDKFFGSGKFYGYEMADLVRNWDKVEMAIYGFGILQTFSRTDDKKTGEAMNFIAQMSGDEKLYEISYEFGDLAREAAVDADSAENDVVEEFVRSEKPDNETAEQSAAETDKPDTVSTKTEDPTHYAQRRERLLQKFVSRYQETLANKFETVPEKEEKTAEIIK